MASAAAGRVRVGAPVMSATTSRDRVAHLGSCGKIATSSKATSDGQSVSWGQPRLVSPSVFFRAGAGVDRFVLRASNLAVDGSSNNTSTKFEVPLAQERPPVSESPSSATSSIATAASVFMADVANLIKLVDSRDIVELELKQKDYELIIRKKEALPPPPTPQHMSNQGPHVMAHTMFPGFQPQAQPQPQPQPSEEAPAPAPPAPLPDAIPLAAEHPPMLSPMAGTFYRSPGPGEKAFVKVGDKVTKGQVVCIVEAMKLMNEIEADQSGTIVEIVAEDGKPVSIESPLFVIKP